MKRKLSLLINKIHIYGNSKPDFAWEVSLLLPLELISFIPMNALIIFVFGKTHEVIKFDLALTGLKLI